MAQLEVAFGIWRPFSVSTEWARGAVPGPTFASPADAHRRPAEPRFDYLSLQSRSGLSSPAAATATPETEVATQGPQPTFLNRADPASGRIVGTLTKVSESEYKLDGIKELTGRYDFVVRGGQIVLGRGHYTLAGGGKPVSYAGEIAFDQGRIVDWSNASGHYRPSAAFAGNAGLPLELFRAANFPVMVGLPQVPLYR